MPADTENRLYYVDIPEAAGILHTTVSAIHLMLSNFRPNGCICSTVLTWEMCAYGYPALETNTQTVTFQPWNKDIKNVWSSWPTITCPMTRDVCKSIGGVYETESLVQQDIHPVVCHCTVGYYGVYSRNNLETCVSCPYGTTSLPATNNRAGCYCARGFARNKNSNAWECSKCSDVYGDTYYCSGGIEDSTTVIMLLESFITRLLSTQAYINFQIETCTVCRCAANTATLVKVATRKIDCVLYRNMRFENSEVVYCDSSIYNTSEITIFDKVGVYCSRSCVSGAIFNQDGDCR